MIPSTNVPAGSLSPWLDTISQWVTRIMWLLDMRRMRELNGSGLSSGGGGLL